MTKPIPDGYHTITPYLTVPDAERLLAFLQAALGAKLLFRHNRADGTFRHGEVEIGDSKVMIGQATEQFRPRPQTLYVYLPDVDASYQRALDSGAKSLTPVATQFYGDRSGGFEDPAGNWWWVATHVEDVSEDEMNRRARAQEAKEKVA